jgi:hypothetical protein
MAATLVTPTWVMKEVTRRLTNNMVFGNHVSRDLDEQFVQAGAKVGDTVKARLPQRYIVTKGAALTKSDANDRTVDISLTDQAHVGIEFSSASLTMQVDNYRKRYIDPAVDALVNTVDSDGLSRMYKKVFLTAGTPNVVPGSTGTLPQAANDVYLNASVRLTEQAVSGKRTAILSANMHAFLMSANVALFQPAGDVASRWKTGQFAEKALGIDTWLMDQNVATHTVGALGTTPLVLLGDQTGSAINIDGATASVTGYFKQGDVVQFAGVKSVNPMSRASTNRLMDFVVTADTNSDGSGLATIPIYPELVISGPLQNVTNAPANDAAVTTFGHASTHAGLQTPQGLLFTEDAFALVMADLPLPGGLWVSERISNKALAISVRFLKTYNIDTDQSPARIDLLYGWAAVRPELAARICS